MVPFPDLPVLGRDHHDKTDSPYRETANIKDGSMFTADMSVHRILLATHSEVLLGLVYTMEVALAGEGDQRWIRTSNRWKR